MQDLMGPKNLISFLFGHKQKTTLTCHGCGDVCPRETEMSGIFQLPLVDMADNRITDFSEILQVYKAGEWLDWIHAK